jgi:predicted naringenin-chalcone synthase
MSRIISIGTAVPGYGVEQDRILDFMIKAYNNETASRKLKILFRAGHINTRYSAIPDFDDPTPQVFVKDDYPDIAKRMAIFKEKAAVLAVESVKQAIAKIKDLFDISGITHLITVSCTGLHAPGLDSVIIKMLNLQDDVFRIPVNFHGCNAAFPALKIADMITRTEVNARVLVICIELCTLHFQPKNDDDNLLSNSLFGDGAAAVLVVPDNFANSYGFSGLSINSFYTSLAGEGSDLMGWNINPLNFEMILSPEIPVFIGKHARKFFNAACAKMNLLSERINHWAVHPGGRKILDEVKKALELDEDSLAPSYQVLQQYGNMSSPTIIFVLDQILKQKMEKGNTVFAMGFGPGISIDASWFTYA